MTVGNFYGRVSRKKYATNFGLVSYRHIIQPLTLPRREFYPNAVFGTFWNVWGKFFFRTSLGGNYLQSKACKEPSGYYLIAGKNAIIKYYLCKCFAGTMTSVFFLFLENMEDKE